MYAEVCTRSANPPRRPVVASVALIGFRSRLKRASLDSGSQLGMTTNITESVSYFLFSFQLATLMQQSCNIVVYSQFMLGKKSLNVLTRGIIGDQSVI